MRERRHPLDAVVDRPRNEAALAVAGAWLAFMAGLVVGGEVADPVSFVMAGAGGAALVWLGFAAASHCRPLPARSGGQRGRLAFLSVAVGAGLGLANLAANWMIAGMDPRVRTAMIERVRSMKPEDAVVASPIVEEVVIRLFLMSAIAWVVLRFTTRAGLAVALALVGSAFLVALPHLSRPFPADAVLANSYRAALLAKYTLAGVMLGWIYWRWGLPYSILCHAAANAAHLALQERLF